MASLRFDDPRFEVLRRAQDGVVARRQILELGGTPADVRRMLRRRELALVGPGVYVNHTGPASRHEREWAAVLSLWPAALSHASALRSLSARQRGDDIRVAVARGRAVRAPDGVAVTRIDGFAERVNAAGFPPRIRPEHALIDAMSERLARDDVAGAFDVLATVAGAREVYVDRVRTALDGRSRIAGRGVLEGLLADHASGACSVLERGYLHRVERAHGLPRGRRQVASDATGRRTFNDVRYADYGVIVELDGRAFHDSPQARDNDARRDLAELATNGDLTARVTYGLVFGDQCRTAVWLGRVFRQRGWRGIPTRCPRCPSAR